MSSKYLNALATVQATNKRLGALVLVVAALGAVGMYFAARTPHRIDVNLHPNIQGGDVVTVTDGQSPVPDVNVYGFAYYIWQQVNRWQADGYKDYGKQIYYYQAYITPSCRAQLENDMNTRDRAGELRSRTRIMTEMPSASQAQLANHDRPAASTRNGVGWAANGLAIRISPLVRHRRSTSGMAWCGRWAAKSCSETRAGSTSMRSR